MIVDQTAPTATLADPGAYLRARSASRLGRKRRDKRRRERRLPDLAGRLEQLEVGRSPARRQRAVRGRLDTTDTALVPADGNYDLRVLVTDSAGNAAAYPLASPRLVDNTAPAATMTAPPAYVTGTVTLASTQSDAGSGLAADAVTYQFEKVGDSSWTTTPAAWDTTPFRGAYQVRTVVVDRAGNETDTTPLDTYLDHDPTATTDDAPTAWQNADVTVHLRAIDPLDENGRASGVAHSEYSVDSAVGPFVTGSAVAIPAAADHSWDGIHTVYYRSQDIAGNLEDAPTTVRIDTTPPTATLGAVAPAIRSSAR